MQRSHRVSVLLLVLVAGLAIGGCQALADEPQYGGVFRIASTGEPTTLDMLITSAADTRETGKHVFETLFVPDAAGSPIPFLVDSYEWRNGNTELYLVLREGVLFHNGDEMTSADVVACLNRWGEYSANGKLVFKNVDRVTAVDEYAVDILFSAPYPPTLRLLAEETSSCIIVPAEIAERYGGQPIAPEDYIGTGPYRFNEWIPTVHISFVRFDDYLPRDEPANGMGGARVAYFDEVQFIPVPEAATRLAGLEVGEFDFVTRISPDDFPLIEALDNAVPLTYAEPGYNLIIFNTQSTVVGDPILRQALLAALDVEPILTSAYGSEDFFDATGYYYPEGTALYTTAGLDYYDQADVARAQSLASQAGYAGEAIRYMTTAQYAEHYDQGIIILSEWAKAGFNIDFQVMDYATLTARRSDPTLWDAFFTRFGYREDPSGQSFLNPAWAGWWDTPEKQANYEVLLNSFDEDERIAAWDNIQRLIYEEVPHIMIGKHVYTGALASKVKNFTDSIRFFAWNAWFGEE
ncbi:hypothetical protein KJ567_03210 [Candidatus Bipolaricaulota bacterium]|nr:hypothetical protein [Candidatus Bipolaricaulota bacterium]